MTKKTIYYFRDKEGGFQSNMCFLCSGEPYLKDENTWQIKDEDSFFGVDRDDFKKIFDFLPKPGGTGKMEIKI